MEQKRALLGMQQAKLASVTQWTNATHSSHATQDDGADAPYLGAYALRFKLHLIINDRGELLAFKLTTCGQALCGNTDDRKPVPDMTQDIIGKLFGDRGYISQSLFEQLYHRGLKLITRRKKNMKQQLVKLMDKILLRKRSLIETVNDQLKNIFQIEHSKHRSVWNFMVNLFSGLIAYTYLPKKPSLDLEPKGLPALPSALI